MTRDIFFYTIIYDVVRNVASTSNLNNKGGGNMDRERVKISFPFNLPCYFAEVPLRFGPDFGKWSDVKAFLDLISGGRVLNFCGRLRPYDGDGFFKGFQVLVRILPNTSKGGRIIVSAGSDPKYDCWVERDAFARDDFDKSKLPLCVLSLLDFSAIQPADIHITIVSPIGAGASLGTSAAMEIAILRAFLGFGFPADEIAKMAIVAEKVVFGGNTGNQDQIASAYGSSFHPSCCQDISISDLYDFKVALPRVGQNIRQMFNCSVAIYLGWHDSSDIHQRLMNELLAAAEEETKAKLIAMRDTARMAGEAVAIDDTVLFAKACESMLIAQSNLGEGLINPDARLLIDTARTMPNFVGGAVPGAGGYGGTTLVCFSDKNGSRTYVSQLNDLDLKFPYTIYEMQLTDEPISP